MRYENKLNLPKVFVNYFKSETKEIIPNRYSVTELLNSVQEIKLKREHINELTIDITECIPALIGTSVHEWLEKNNDEIGDEREYKFELPFKNNTIVGIIDVLNRENKIIKDYKTCSASKIQQQDFTDWYLQGMLYSYAIWELYNIKIEKVQFLAMIKDWSKLKSIKVGGYPQSPVYVYEFEPKDTDFIEIENYLSNKIKLLESPEIQLCSDKDRWYSGDVYAVYKSTSDSKASKLCKSEEEAQEFISNKLNGIGTIEVRKGENLKCEYYCSVKDFCEQHKSN